MPEKGFIISSKECDEAKMLIAHWAKDMSIVEKLYYNRNKVINNRDYDFLKLLGESIYYINLYNSYLIKKIEKKVNYSPHEFSQNEIESLTTLANYIKFFNSLISSKVKYFFFRETPIIATNKPFIKWNWEILQCAKKILEDLNTGNINITTIKNAGEYFFNLTLIYSFVYNAEIKKGTFLRFHNNHDDFKLLKEITIALINNINDEEDLREFGSNFIARIALFYTVKMDKKFKHKYKRDIYAKLFECINNNDNFALNPFFWHLSDIIWKVDGMIQDDDEFISLDKKSERDMLCISLIKKFITKYIDETEVMSESGATSYVTIFKLESKLINDIYKVILPGKTSNDIALKINDINEKIRINLQQAKTITPTISKKIKKIEELLAYARKENENGFKLQCLFETSDTDELLLLLSLYAQMINIDILKNPKTEFVAFYVSGVFLAHFVNIYHRLTKPIWIFKTKPYVATHPIHEDTDTNLFNNIIIFDDCFKTGFTYSLYEAYMMRNFDHSHVSTYIYSIFDFDYYKKIPSLYKINSFSLIKINESLLSCPTNDLKVFKKSIQDRIYITCIASEHLKTMAKDLIAYTELITGRRDLTIFLSSTSAMLAICNFFTDEIIIAIEEKNKKLLKNVKLVFLYSPSGYGEILMMMTSLLLKIAGYTIIYDNNTEADRLNVAIDLSYETGFTFAYGWSTKITGTFNTDNAEEFFDIICTITKRNNDNNKIKSIVVNA